MVDFDETASRRIERREKPLARTLRIETADALEAVAHRGDADRDERFGVGVRDGDEDQGHGADAIDAMRGTVSDVPLPTMQRCLTLPDKGSRAKRAVMQQPLASL